MGEMSKRLGRVSLREDEGEAKEAQEVQKGSKKSASQYLKLDSQNDNTNSFKSDTIKEEVNLLNDDESKEPIN